MSVAQAFSKHAPSVKLMSMTGGADAEDSNQKFIAEGANVVVGTPGRLAHVIGNLEK
jgi:superfamily II DNA/RNA helicase